MPNYIPARDVDFDTWCNNFQAVIAAAPATYGLLAGDATGITASFNSWHTAYLAATNPATRTPVTIATKDTAKAATLIVMRTYASLIGANQGVSSGAKTAAGLTNRSTGRTPIPAPGTSPKLAFIGATPLQSTLGFADVTTPLSKAKPFGAIQMELWVFISATPPVSTADYQFNGLYTKSPISVDFVSGDVGKQAYYLARWVTRRGLSGPWSTAIHHAVV